MTTGAKVLAGFDWKWFGYYQYTETPWNPVG